MQVPSPGARAALTHTHTHATPRRGGTSSGIEAHQSLHLWAGEGAEALDRGQGSGVVARARTSNRLAGGAEHH